MRIEIPIIRPENREAACKIEHKNYSRLFLYRSTMSVKISVYYVVRRKSTGVSEEYIASIINVEE
jgi:hypothetical protein